MIVPVLGRVDDDVEPPEPSTSCEDLCMVECIGACGNFALDHGDEVCIDVEDERAMAALRKVGLR